MDAPRGFAYATEEALTKWRRDQFAQSLDQYAESNMVQHSVSKCKCRLVSAEEERFSGYHTCYTLPVKSLCPKDPVTLERKRKSLLGNAWITYQTKFWVLVLLQSLGL